MFQNFINNWSSLYNFLGIPGCEPCEGYLLDEVIITAPRLPQSHFSSIFDDLAGSFNPIYRNIGLQYNSGNYGYLSHAFNQSPIRYGEGLGYETDFMYGMNTIGERVSAGLIYTSLAALAVPVVVYGAPLLVKSGAFSLSGGFSTSAILTRVGIEIGSQTVVNMASFGLEGWRNLDIADVIISSSGLNFLSGSAISASADWRPFYKGVKFQTIGYGQNDKSAVRFVSDLSVELISGGQSKLLNSSQVNKSMINIFDLWNTTKANAVGEVVKKRIE